MNTTSQRPHRQRWIGIAAVPPLLAMILWLAPPAVGEKAGENTGKNTVDRTIVICQKILRVRPDDAAIYYKLGDAYVEKGRETGDITYYDLASQSLQHALKLEPDLGPARRHLAYVLYSLHDFDGAARESRRAIALRLFAAKSAFTTRSPRRGEREHAAAGDAPGLRPCSGVPPQAARSR